MMVSRTSRLDIKLWIHVGMMLNSSVLHHFCTLLSAVFAEYEPY